MMFFCSNRKFSIFVIFLATSISLAQDDDDDVFTSPVDCRFEHTIRGYTCVLTHIELLNPNITVVFRGQHIGDRTDGLVYGVHILDSWVTFIIPSMFSQFRNLRYLDYIRTNISELSFPTNATNLRELTIVGGTIDRIENKTFIHSPSMTRLEIRENKISEIGEEAFAGLDNLVTLRLFVNEITEIPRRALHDIPKVTLIDFGRNFLTRISAESFAASTALRDLHLEFNQITDVEGTFAEAFKSSIVTLDISRNLCTNSLHMVDERQ